MKKLIVLGILLLTSLSSFSQIDTTKIAIKTSIARLVIAELVQYDGCVLELKATQEKVLRLEERDFQKNGIITLLQEKDTTSSFIIATQKNQINISEELTENLNKEVRKQRTKTFLYKVGTVLGVLCSSYLLIK